MQADWHAHSFWDPAVGFAGDRNANYDVATNASKWATFVEFDRQQLAEIQERYVHADNTDHRTVHTRW